MMSLLSIPTSAALPNSQLLPATHPITVKSLQRLSRPALLTLALDWLSPQNQEDGLTTPYLNSLGSEQDEQDLYTPVHSLDELREVYTELQKSRGSKRDVLDRILEGDWRNGLSLYQLAMVDMQYLYDHPTSQKWSALKLVKMEAEKHNRVVNAIPRFHPQTFLRNLQSQILPDVKAHYNLDRHEKLGLTFLRVFIVDSPYNTGRAMPETAKSTAAFITSRTFYVAFPDAAPYVYVSLTTTIPSTQGRSTLDQKSLRNLVLDGIPRAFSRPRERYSFAGTSFTARNLEALVEKRGGGKSNAAGGGWGVYSKEDKNDTPLNIHLPTPESLVDDDDVENNPVKKVTGMKRMMQDDEGVVKRRKLVAQGRFGHTAKHDDGKGIDRFEVLLRAPIPHRIQLATELEKGGQLEDIATSKKRKGRRSTLDMEVDRHDQDEIEKEEEARQPKVRIAFIGKHVFASIRNLVEEGVIDGERMPGWMTGEEGVTVGLVHRGRIKGFKGSGV